MLLLRAARSWARAPQGRSPLHPLAALSQVLKLERSRRDGVVFPLRRLARNLVPGAEEATFALFQPELSALQRAEALFTSGRGHAIDYVSSAERMEHAPLPALPEVCFIGRSNVGKSSLIRALFALAPEVEVRVSKTPFASISDSLKRTFLLVDGVVGIQSTDLIAVEMLEEFGIPYVMVVTKIDRASKGLLLKNVLKIQEFGKEKTQGCFPQLFLVRFSVIARLTCVHQLSLFLVDTEKETYFMGSVFLLDVGLKQW
ncbi:hypothetical protein ASZ78_014494 [Callipepla squamata]|uniref:G domain-containing protein n=1 Tax=Callipepla squamata TaxID=9009 RepID=A0A226N4X3_CALSU|nr:hypothetical protein ASZ78_014494 [Callipepla squamata]